ncbi:MAG: hypothetical protein ABJQ71_05920 [Roseibium sp.]
MTIKTSTESNFELGAKLGAIIQDSESRSKFAQTPNETLHELGVKANVTVLADTADMVHLVIPASIDEKRAVAGDESYFEELGRLALGSCMYEDMPD